MMHWPNAGWILARRLRRRPNIHPVLGQCIVFARPTFDFACVSGHSSFYPRCSAHVSHWASICQRMAWGCRRWAIFGNFARHCLILDTISVSTLHLEYCWHIYDAGELPRPVTRVAWPRSLFYCPNRYPIIAGTDFILTLGLTFWIILNIVERIYEDKKRRAKPRSHLTNAVPTILVNFFCGFLKAAMEKLCLADAIHNFKWVKIMQIWQNGGQFFSNRADWCHIIYGFNMFKRRFWMW